jgi:2-succinyl-6-hydroxy-2,4-cyclohexadiene-1-carboxylate synthase
MTHCLHGAVGSFRAWETLGQELKESVNALDLWRLFDHSTPTLIETGQVISEDAEFGDVILGYSMGGRLALHALIAAPEKWRAAIIVSAHPGLISGQEERREKDREWANISRGNWTSFIDQWNRQEVFLSSPEEFHQANVKDQEMISKSFLYWSLGNQRDLRSKLPEITCPILWITGSHDPKFTALAEEATSLLPNSEHLIISGSGHRVPWQRPTDFSVSVQNFLERNASF